jgi:quercetin dioxygenase-like cupin family protein
MRIIRPADVAPIDNVGYPPETVGKIFHRRILNPANGGPASIDIGYNIYAGGLGGRRAYAYTKDEFCYTAAGAIRTESSGRVDTAAAGTFMWRPAGSATHAIAFMEDAISICAFAPARADDWSHRLDPETVGEWNGDGTGAVHPIFRHYSEIAPSAHPHAPSVSGVEYRRIFCRTRDGTAHMDMAHSQFDAGISFANVTDGYDEIWWIERGEIEVTANAGTQRLTAHDFLFRGAGERLDAVKVVSDAIVISWSATPVG